MRQIRRGIPCRFSLKQLSCIGFFLATSLLIASPGAAGLCGTWDIVATPNVGNSVTRLRAVTSLSANDAWSVGLWRDNPAGRGPLVLRWDGSIWSRTDLPDTGELGAYPETEGVDAAPNGDVWVVGNVTTTYPTYNLPLALRWREGSWDQVETVTLRPQTVYPFAARGGSFYEVDALASDDIWAVGQAAGFGDGGATTAPLAAHWDGSGWTDVEVPRISNRHHQLSDVFAISHDDVWAVGDYRNVAAAFHAVTYHWDGSEWSHVHSPIEDMSESGLDDVVATGPNDVWAVGGASDVGVVLMHWDGSHWSLVQSPPNSGGSLAAVGPDDLWMSGWNGFWHWDGATWTEVPASVPGASYVIRSGGMEIVGGCDIWCVGFWTEADGITSYTLAERLRSPATSVVEDQDASPSLAFRNPFVPGSQIRFELPSDRPASLILYDMRGRMVKSLFESPSGGGSRSLMWDGRGDAGGLLPTGVYFLKLVEGGKTTTAKLVLLK
jgi:hypothetical protein